METTRLFDRDDALLAMLTQRVKVVAVEDLVTAFGKGEKSPRAFVRRLNQLERAGWLRRFDVFASPSLNFDAPLLSWQPGEGTPDLTEVSRRLRARWKMPVATRAILAASQLAANRYGVSQIRPPRQSETSHDVSLGSLYLYFRTNDPLAAATWQNETALRKLGHGRCSALPDALIHRDGRPVAIELGGQYSVSKLDAFHTSCQMERLSYEIW